MDTTIRIAPSAALRSYSAAALGMLGGASPSWPLDVPATPNSAAHRPMVVRNTRTTAKQAGPPRGVSR